MLPKSTEEKIKVDLLTPTAKDLASNTVMQNKMTNNIVFNFTLDPGAKRELLFEYNVSHPSDKNVESYDQQQ